MKTLKNRRGADINTQLRGAFDILSRADVEQAEKAANAITKALGTSKPVLLAEVAARLLARIVSDVSAGIKNADDLAAALPAIEGQHVRRRPRGGDPYRRQ
jgi:hypothetical protein